MPTKKTTKVAIVGLGQIGSSIGLALKAKGGAERLVGFDHDRKVAKLAEARGAIDASARLKDTVRDAELVFLCLPLGEIRDILTTIGPWLKDAAVVVDTAPSKAPVIQWIRELVPAGRHYIGLVPAINPSKLAASEVGIEAAHSDLFKRSVMMVVAPPETAEAVEQLGMNIARLLGAKPMLTGLAESDGIMTAVHVLPQLAAAALVEASVAESGWIDARKMAGRPFTMLTGGLAYFDDAASVGTAALANPERAARALDVLIASLRGLRDDIAGGDGNRVGERLGNSFDARERWLNERGEAAWLAEGSEPVKLPGLEQQLVHMFFGGRIADKMNEPDDERKDGA
jgi:prephenate dehydrogenase